MILLCITILPNAFKNEDIKKDKKTKTDLDAYRSRLVVDA